MRVPVLAYHAVNVAGNAYADNDHVAFAADLRLIDDLGMRVVSLHTVVDALLGGNEDSLAGAVALSCDDGSILDFYDVTYPGHGRQRSLFNLMRDFQSERGTDAQPGLHLTSFVIASEDARACIDRAKLDGRGWMGSSWWRAALASRLMAIENHSFDHNHAVLPEPGPDGMERGSFWPVDSPARAEAEIAAAQQWLHDRLAPHRSTLFCYPYGHAPDYLREDWLPMHGATLGLRAAFGDGGRPVTDDSDRWNLPRYVCGWHWKSPEELAVLLRDAMA